LWLPRASSDEVKRLPRTLPDTTATSISHFVKSSAGPRWVVFRRDGEGTPHRAPPHEVIRTQSLKQALSATFCGKREMERKTQSASFHGRSPQPTLGPRTQSGQRKTMNSRELVAPACNPSYSGGRDQEDRGSKPVWANG
jgi:hypothetical protein